MAERLSQSSTVQERILSEEEKRQMIMQERKLVSEFRRNELDRQAKKMWDLFYKRNKTNFFKDRHWTSREFEELKVLGATMANPILLEAGCGVGNFMFPIMEEIPNLFVYACDFSPRAVEFVQNNEKYASEKCKGFQCDLTLENCFEDHVSENSVDVISLIFVLSAISPEKFLKVLQNCFHVLKPGGYVLFRDYGVNDYAMIRFGPGNKISDNFYARQDATRAYYFSIKLMDELTKTAGYDIILNEYVLRETVNKKEGISVPRVFLQGKYMKPHLQ